MNSQILTMKDGDIIDLDNLSVVIEQFVILGPEDDVLNPNANDQLPQQGNSETNKTEVGADQDEILNDSKVDTDIEKKTRKRLLKEKTWKRNVRQKKHQAGEAYISSRGKAVPQKEIKSTKNCFLHCKLHCEQKVSTSERKTLFESFYSLDRDGKSKFILKCTTKNETSRQTKKSILSRRSFTFGYFVELSGNKIQVCKSFWLGTFSISQKSVYNAHKKKNNVSGIAKKCEKGKKSVRRISETKLSEIKAHISSFPKIESHYCRAKTAKLYLDPSLNITKMYDLYKDTVEDPVKESFYRYVFNTNFNLDFHRPKSDKCGKCEAYRAAEKENALTEILIRDHEIHLDLKKMIREQKALDKESGIPILTFDLQNVISCPRAEIGPMFYNSKLNIYNLTAHLSTTKKIYCAIWTEYTGGRSGNDISAALMKIFERVFEENDIANLITWSDSCVPQNKNSIMALAIQHFIKTHPYVESITLKYSLPGHSALQEVDNAHSQIEKHLSVNEYFSPMGLIRLLKTVNTRKPLVIIQMQSCDFKDFAKYAKICFDYKNIPFSKLKILKFTKAEFEIEFSLDYDAENMTCVVVRRIATRLRKSKVSDQEVPILQEDIETVPSRPGISKEKEKHLLSMFKYMSAADKSYYKVILKLNDETS